MNLNQINTNPNQKIIAEYDHHHNGTTMKIYKDGDGYYGKSDDFDFLAKNLSHLRENLLRWGYTVHSHGLDLIQ